MQFTNTSIATFIEAAPILVEIKKNWSNSWISMPSLIPVSCSFTAAPKKNMATFEYNYGKISFQEDSNFVQYKPLDFYNHFVRITPQSATGGWCQPWIGFITDEIDDLFGGSTSTPMGKQSILAFGLEHILDKLPLTKSFVADSSVSPNGTSGYSVVNSALAFNKFSSASYQIIGNRSEAKNYTFGCYHFGNTIFPWTNLDIVKYLLVHITEICAIPAGFDGLLDNMAFVLTGQTEALANIVQVQRLSGLSIMQILDHLIDRRRGISWCIRMDGDNNNVCVHVFSTLGTDSKITDVDNVITIPENNEQIYIDISGVHEVESCDLKTISGAQYDRVEVHGGNLKSCFSAVIDLGQTTTPQENGVVGLLPAWNYGTVLGPNLNNEINYVQNPLGLTPEAIAATPTLLTNTISNDAARNSERFSHIFCNFKFNPAFTGTVTAPIGTTTNTEYVTDDHGYITEITHTTPITGVVAVFPKCLSDGTISIFEPSSFYPYGKTFERKLPFKKATVGISQEVVTDEYEAPLAWGIDSTASPSVFFPLEKPTQESVPPIPPASARMSSNALEIIVKPTYNHAYAKGYFSSTSPTAVSNNEALLRPQDLLFTLCVESDEKIHVALDMPQANAPSIPRVLVIDCENAEAWYVVPGTFTGISNDSTTGVSRLNTHSGGLVRNPASRLRAIAAMACAWYGQLRQALDLKHTGIVDLCRVGQYITSVVDTGQTRPVGTVVTSITWNFNPKHPTTHIVTEFQGQDFSGIEFPNLSGPRAVAREIRSIRNDLEEANARLVNLVDRQPVGVGGTGGGTGGGIVQLDLFSGN